MSGLNVSMSSIGAYLKCGRLYYYMYKSGLPRKTDYPRACGIAVHQHVWQMHQPVANPRAFFFERKGSALKAWIFRWRHALEEITSSGKLERRDANEDLRFERLGILCIAKYWDIFGKLLPPLSVERRYEHVLASGVKLVGIADQIRQVSPEYIAKHRPDLIIGGKLKDGYDPVIIMDLKTGYHDFDVSRRRFNRDPNLIEKVRAQFELHENLQATALTFLYQQANDGRKPIGFVWYHMRSGAAFFTYRGEADYQTLYGDVYHLVENVDAESFPKHVGPHCGFCDHFQPCRENRDFLLVTAENPSNFNTRLAIPVIVPTGVIKSGRVQKRLKLRWNRTKSATPAGIPVAPIAETKPACSEPIKPVKIKIQLLPWDGLKPEEQLKLITGASTPPKP